MAGIQYRPPGVTSKVSQVAFTIAAVMAGSSAAVSLSGLNLRSADEMNIQTVSHLLGVAAGALAFHRALLNFRAITGARIMSAWSTAVIAYGPIAAVITLTGIIVLAFVDVPQGIRGSLAGIGILIYLGWLLAALAWPSLWIRLLGVRADGSSVASGTMKLTVWAAFAAASAGFLAGYAKQIGFDAVTAEIVGSIMSVMSLLVGKQMTQDVEIRQLQLAHLKGLDDGSTPQPILIRLPEWALWAIILLSVAITSAVLTKDANNIFKWF
jgi:hypothetical protein